MDVSTWLRDLGLEHYVQAFEAHDIDAAVLSRLTADDLIALGISSIGHRRKLLDAIAALDQGRGPPAAAAPAAGQRIEAERRQLTVLFCDLVGSTELAARLDPEDLREVIRGYHEKVAAAVERFEGHVAKYLGDGVVVYFGWPRAHEDDAERAVRAGLAVIDAVAHLSAGGSRLEARVGIATGLAVVGDLIGEGSAREESVVGETPALAARLQAFAPSGAVVIGDATRRLVSGVFELDDVGPQRLKGFAEPLAVWRVAGESRAEGRFEARQTTGLTPLAGREEEIALLLGHWRQAQGGEGQVVLLSGEPGIGKSRLARELAARLEGKPHIRLLYQCSPYHSTSPLHPVIEQLERAAGFTRDDPPEGKLVKLEALLARGTDKIDQAVQLIAALLEIPTGERYPALAFTPQRQKDLMLEALLDQLAGLAAEQPVLVVHEDVHWVDSTTQELLSLAIERISRLPILLLVTFRPEFAAPWFGQPHVRSRALTRLGRRDGALMVDRVVGEKSLPAEVIAQIVAKTDGVPLFVEELTRAMLESGVLRDAGDRYGLAGPLPPLAIPSTLHDSLVARLDRLAPAREVAQIGAAIGREFSHALLAAVADRPEPELAAALDQLVSSELVFRRGSPPEAIYSFKHALVQDAAYGMLLKSRRRQLHGRIAEALEEQFQQITKAEPAVVAHHCTEAGWVEKAVNYRRQAAQLAITRSANVEAIAEATKGLELLMSLPECPDRHRQELDLQVMLGRGLLVAKEEAAPEAGRAYARALELCAQVGGNAHLFSALYGRYLFHYSRGELIVAHRLAHDFHELAQRQRHADAEVTGKRMFGVISLHLGRPIAARAHLEQALALERGQHSSQFIYVYDPRVLCLSFLSATLFALGYPDQAVSRIQQAVAEARALAHPESLAFAANEAAWLYFDLRNAKAVQEQAEKLIEFATERGFPHYAREGKLLQAWTLAQQGATDRAIGQMRECLTATKAESKGIGTPWRLLLLAGLHTRAKQASNALDRIAEALSLMRSTGECRDEAELHLTKGEALLALSPARSVEAEASFHEALAVARGQGAKMWELRAATSLARLWRDQSRCAEAHDLLAPVYGWFTEGFDTADLKDAKSLLDELG